MLCVWLGSEGLLLKTSVSFSFDHPQRNISRAAMFRLLQLILQSARLVTWPYVIPVMYDLQKIIVRSRFQVCHLSQEFRRCFMRIPVVMQMQTMRSLVWFKSIWNLFKVFFKTKFTVIVWKSVIYLSTKCLQTKLNWNLHLQMTFVLLVLPNENCGVPNRFEVRQPAATKCYVCYSGQK